MSRTKLLKEAITRYGVEAQLNQAVEECAELIIAIRHHLRGRDSNIAEEVADVDLMIDQIKLMIGPGEVEQYKGQKLQRLAERLEVDI